MIGDLSGRRVAILATDGFEQSELLVPREALLDAGAAVEIISLRLGQIQGMEHHDKGKKINVDKTLDDADAADYSALVLPGGVANPDQLRTESKAIDFVRHFVETEKPIAAICHGPWTLIEVDAVRNRTLTSWPSLRTDLLNAGAHWVDREVVVDHRLVTSRKPDDLPAFCAKMIAAIREGRA
jgi:protease I